MRRALFGAASVSLQPIILNIVSIPVLALIIRGLGSVRYGCWATATALIAASAVLSNLGLRGAFVRAVAKEPQTAPAALAQQLGARLFLAMIASLICLAVCLLLHYPTITLQCTVIAAIGVLFTSFATTLADLLQAFHRLPSVAMANLVSGLALTAASVVAIGLGAGPVGLSPACLLGPVLSAVILWLVVRRGVCAVRIRWNFTEFRQLLRRSRCFAAQQIVNSTSASAASLMLRFGLRGACWFLVMRPLIQIIFLLPEFIRTFILIGDGAAMALADSRAVGG